MISRTALTSDVRRKSRRTSNQRPAVEALEPRQMMAADGNPLHTPEFHRDFLADLRQFGVPQGSVALEAKGQIYTAGATNRSYFKSMGLKVPDDITPASLFRLASLSKPFVAAAVMVLVQQGKVSLDDNPFEVLGYAPGELIYGRDPINPGHTDIVTLPTKPNNLWDITIRDLLQMRSGLPETIPVTSQSFPQVGKKPVYGTVYNTKGSYAALAFQGKPPYTAPATFDQQLRYFLYESVSHDLITKPGDKYKYEDFNFHIAARIIDQFYPTLGYRGFLQQYVLGPMGISAPMSQPVTTNAMIGGSHTLQSQSYPTEVSYYMPKGSPLQISILPDPSKTTPPFYPSQKVPAPYGGGTYQSGPGLVATPTALVTFMNNLASVYTGQGTGPLTKASVAQMIAEPQGGPDLGHTAWFGLGLVVTPSASDPDNLAKANWAKGGDEPGTLTSLKRDGLGGAIIAQTYNLKATKPSEESAAKLDSPGLPALVGNLIRAFAFGPSRLDLVSGNQQSAAVGQAFAQPLTLDVRDFLGGVAQAAFVTQTNPPTQIQVTFSTPQQGPSALFEGGSHTATVGVNLAGQAASPALVANSQAGSFRANVTVDRPGRRALHASFMLQNTAPA